MHISNMAHQNGYSMGSPHEQDTCTPVRQNQPSELWVGGTSHQTRVLGADGLRGPSTLPGGLSFDPWLKSFMGTEQGLTSYPQVVEAGFYGSYSERHRAGRSLTVTSTQNGRRIHTERAPDRLCFRDLASHRNH